MKGFKTIGSRLVGRTVNLDAVKAVWFICFAYVLWRPVSSGFVLYPVLATLGVMSLLLSFQSRSKWERELRWAAAIFAMLSLSYAATALVTRAPGAIHQSVAWVAIPVLWSIWAGSLRERTVRIVLFLVTGVALLASVSIVIYVSNKLHFLPFGLPDFIEKAQGTSFTLGRGASPAIQYFGLSTLVAAGPLAAAAMFAGNDKWLPPRLFLMITGSFCLVASLLAGRRAISLVIILAPILTLLARGLLAMRKGTRFKWKRTVVIGSVAGACLVLLVAISPVGHLIASIVHDVLFTYFGIGSDALATGKSRDNRIRVDQISQLINGWEQHKLFGAGLGVPLTSGYIRSLDRPWFFELQYHQTLYSTGVVGVFVILIVTTLCVVVLARAARTGRHTPTLIATAVSAACFLLANASNPYFQAIGHGWAVFLVLGVTNCILREEAYRTVSEEANELSIGSPS